MHDEDRLDPDVASAGRKLAYPNGFDDFFRTEYRKIMKALMLMGASLNEAEECATHAMCQLLERWDFPEAHPDHIRKPLSYAMTVARRQLRKERGRTQDVALGEVGPVLAADDPGLTIFEERQSIAEIVECLPPAQRQVMLLVTEGLSREEIAEILRKTPNNVRQIIHQAGKRLREQWEFSANGSPVRKEETQ